MSGPDLYAAIDVRGGHFVRLWQGDYEQETEYGDDPVAVAEGHAAEDVLASGVARVVLGTAAVENPDLVAELAHRHPGAVAVGLDSRGGVLASRGWTEVSEIRLEEAVDRFEGSGVAAYVVTDIDRDGTLEGPDLDGLRAVLEATPVPVVGSGGVSSLDDLRALAALRGAGRRLAGVVVGRAIYEGLVTVADAVDALQFRGEDAGQ